MVDERLPQTLTDAEGETADLPEGLNPFTPGQVLGERYRIIQMLGRGGMGEVWHAFDLKLRVEVALKALLPHLVANEKRLLTLRQEVRAAREVVSPNVCRVFDLVEVEGRELVSMEFVDGDTLLKVLKKKGPLDLKEAQDIASQFLAGLEAIHSAGLVHRDIKPENIMLTRAGRVVVMDFGLAREPESGAGTVSGTPAYMSPEQAAGQTVDARADLFAAGVVLAEMVSPGGITAIDSRKSLWERVRSEPAEVAETPWAPVIKKAVTKNREERYDSAHTLTRALEDVTLRVEGADDLHPYPGLAPFTEEDAEYFFGREVEVEQLWRKLEGPPRMLALAGPSGAGKSSFLRAGLIATRRPLWSHVICTPGNDPRAALRRVMISVIEGNPEALRELAAGDEEATVSAVRRWSRDSEHSLVIIDQFEELFTLNTDDEQKRFGSLLERLVLDANVFILASLRDDFLFRCHRLDSLRPVLPDLTMIGAPQGTALRRALIQPAMKCGYRFEDDDLVDEMVAEVEDERGALPLLAFAAARLWERRDKDKGLLYREAYHEVGGVGGALAQHAEATIDRIGVERIPVVRELFRNLVTAEGTRAVREWGELLSIFETDHRREGINPSPTNPGTIVGAGFIPARSAAEEVLRELIDARLLTSYEIHEDEHEPTRNVEIIHESLLSNWPRLVRWQTQDADAAQLRDQLRQAAKTWDEHRRTDDMLWTGAAYREFATWREHYSGGLSKTEEGFARAMTVLASRRKRRRRAAVAALVTVFAMVTALTSTLWRRSVLEARRAEAVNLVSLGQLQLESYPTAAVAHAIASLEMIDSVEARRLALEALWKGPTALVASTETTWQSQFSPDGRWLIQAREKGQNDGRPGLVRFSPDGELIEFEAAHADVNHVFFSSITENGYFISFAGGAPVWKVVLWSTNTREPLAVKEYDQPVSLLGASEDPLHDRFVVLALEEQRAVVDALGFDGSTNRIGMLPVTFSSPQVAPKSLRLHHRAGQLIAVAFEDRVEFFDVLDHSLSEPYHLVHTTGEIAMIQFHPVQRRLAVLKKSGEIQLWNLDSTVGPEVLQGPPGTKWLRFSRDGSLLEAAAEEDERNISYAWDLSAGAPISSRRFDVGEAGWGSWRWNTSSRKVFRWGPQAMTRIWSMDGPVDAEPVVLRRGSVEQLTQSTFNDSGTWAATSDAAGLSLWPLVDKYPRVLGRHKEVIRGLDFSPNGDRLVSSSRDGSARIWPLSGHPPEPSRIVYETSFLISNCAFSPNGKEVLVAAYLEGLFLVPTDGGPGRELAGFTGEVDGLAFSPSGGLVAAAGGTFDPSERQIRIWDTATLEEITILEIPERFSAWHIRFVGEDHILSVSEVGLSRWDLRTRSREILRRGDFESFVADESGRHVVLMESRSQLPGGPLQHYDVDTGEAIDLPKFGSDVYIVATDRRGTIVVTGSNNGDVRVASMSGDEPHLLLGHAQQVTGIAIDPLGRWIATSDHGGTIRLWPMPNLEEPPFHTLPHNKLIAKLKTLTNLRVVRDEDSPTGWELTVGQFPGWETVPTW